MERITKIELRVKDIDKMVAFYENVIGLEVVEKRDDRVILGYPELHLIKGADSLALKPYNGLYHMAFLLPTMQDLGEFIVHLSHLNVGQIGASDHGFSNAIYFSDPENNGIEVYADTPESMWTYQPDGMLTAPSKPLDIDHLVALAKNSYTKIPKDTIFGHIHLEVSDLQKAKEFYVDKLGFDIKINMGHALFVSKDGYHHHMGLNVWHQTQENLPKTMTGLIGYGIKHEELSGEALIDPFGIIINFN